MNLKSLLTCLLYKLSDISPKAVWHDGVNGTDGTWEYQVGNLRFVMGYFEIQPTASRTTSKTVYLGVPITPSNVQLTIQGAPEINTLVLSTNNYASGSFTATIFASNTTNRMVRFLALGKV